MEEEEKEEEEEGRAERELLPEENEVDEVSIEEEAVRRVGGKEESFEENPNKG